MKRILATLATLAVVCGLSLSACQDRQYGWADLGAPASHVTIERPSALPHDALAGR